MAGFRNDVVYADNGDFSVAGALTGSAANGLQTNGQMWIGTTTPNVGGTHINVGAITSPNGTITVGYSTPNITLDIAGGSSAVEHLTADTGGQLNPDGSNNFNLLGSGSFTTVGSGSTITGTLTGLTNHAVLVGAGTTTITKVGPTANTGAVLQNNNGADPSYSTATYPSTTTINQILYSSAANTVGGITTANDGVLITSNTGVPSFLANGTTGQVLVATTGSPPSWGSVPSSFVPGIYGSGADGSQTFDGSSVVLGITPSGSAYTLARDIFLASSTINNGVSIITNGFRIFCNGTLTNNGTIKWNGNNGGNGGAGVTGTGGAALTSSGGIIQTASTAGGNGNNAGGSSGTSAGTQPTLGGAGGNGGNSFGSGGTGATVVATPAAVSPPYYTPLAVFGQGLTYPNISSTGSFIPFYAGLGGGGGSGDNATNRGGGGGGGGGIVIVASYLFAGTGTLQATGGNGGNGTTGNAAGGGGGGGGCIIAISQSASSGSISGQTFSLAGGNAGSSFGSGGAASAGSTGSKIVLNA